MAIVERLEAIPFRIPLRERIAFATGSLDAAEHVLLRLTDSDGVTGIAEAIPRPMIHGETLRGALSVITRDLAPLVIGRRVDSAAAVHRMLSGLDGNLTAKAAVELALADLRGRALGVSCHRLLGGYTDRVRVSAILGYGSPTATVAEARRYFATHGIDAFKIKVGMDVDRDVAACRAVRDAFHGAWIYVDANHAYRAADAAHFLSATRELGLAWFEEPTDGPLPRTRLNADGRAQIVADESAATLAAVGCEVLDGRANGISLKVSRMGYVAADQARAFCEATGTAMLLGSQGDSSIGALAALSFAAAHRSTSRYPCEHSYFLKLGADLLADPPTITDGYLSVPGAPGIGAVLDENALRALRIDR
jgi:L-alanine-DL-glutamate epimerase-like enolase superfamily enzyme